MGDGELLAEAISLSGQNADRIWHRVEKSRRMKASMAALKRRFCAAYFVSI